MKTVDNKNYYPMLVSETALKDDSSEEFLNKWKQYDNISEKLQNLLTSREMTFLISIIAKKHNLTNQESAELSRNVRRLFFRELSEEAFSKKMSEILGGDESNGKIIISAIKKLKISNAPLRIKDPEIEKLTLQEALTKYPEINKSLITSNFLKFPNSDKKIIPTIKNWLDLYDQEVGVKKQTTVQRGKFLYSSLNCAKLKEKERELISKLLQSRDENTKLNLDKETHEIISNEVTDLNNYKSLISKTKVFTKQISNKVNNFKGKNDLNKSKITSINNLKGQKSSPSNISPQHFSKLSSNKISTDANKLTSNKIQRNISSAITTNKKSDISSVSNISFSSGQKLSTESLTKNSLNKKNVFNIKPISKSK